MERIEAVIERVTFYSDESGFSVLQAYPRGSRREKLTIVGKLPPVSPGEEVEVEGEWKHDPSHGRQFAAETLSIRPPSSPAAVEKLLASGLIRGVGPHLARLLVRHFGMEVVDVIEKTPRRLREVSGIGAAKCKQIAQSWEEVRGLRDLMLFLHGHGVGTARIRRIWKEYGANAVGMIRANPYRLADEVRGIGFVSADRVAMSLGFEKSSMFRARAGLTWVLNQARSDGHCGLPRAALVEEAARLLEIDPGRISEALETELTDKTLVEGLLGDEPAIFLPWLFIAEERVAEAIRILCGREDVPWPSIDAEKAIGWVEGKTGVELSSSQRDAVRLALRSRLLVITGGPGVGKTTLINSIIRILTVKGVEVLLAAPTGRAAKRLSESTGFTAKTIHRLLEINPQTGRFTRDEENPLDLDLLIVDETSMVDLPLMHSLVRALPARAAVILVGDVDQLPPVGPGEPFRDIIASGVAPVARLTEIFRQHESSGIVLGAHAINEGRMPEFDSRESAEPDFFFVERKDAEATAEMVRRLVRERIPQRFGLDPMRDVQVLSPMNKGAAGVAALNALLQSSLNPGAASDVVERFGTQYGAGDKVMQTENDYDKEVFNGDIGVIRRIDRESKKLWVAFEGRSLEYGIEELDRIVLAYATTIHKSQGSEYPAVVIPLTTQHYVMLERNLLYTAVTRGKQLVVLVGQKQALAQAIRNRAGRHRWTRLKELLEKREV